MKLQRPKGTCFVIIETVRFLYPVARSGRPVAHVWEAQSVGREHHQGHVLMVLFLSG